MINLLPNPAFLDWLLAGLARARKSILLVNYLAVIEDGDRKGPVLKIVESLAKACRRGVKVEVVLEGSKFRENYAFYRFLKEAGADVWMDTSLTFIHMKAILIDGILCVGSHNLTASAITSHEELAVATDSKSTIRRFRKEFDRITEQRRSLKGSRGEGVELPEGVIDALVKIKRSISPHAYLLYLLLIKLDRGRPKDLKVEEQEWMRVLALSPSVASDQIRIWGILDFLDRSMKLVSLNRKKGLVRRKTLKDSDTKIVLPDAFWMHGWQERLSVEAIHLYFAGERERQQSPYAPWWRLKRDEIAAKYCFQKQLVNRAYMELRRAGLLEIIFEIRTVPKGGFARQMNYFRQNPFYDMASLEAKMRALKGRYPPKVFEIAKGLLATTCDDSDIEKMAAICSCVSEKGQRAGRRVLKAVAHLSPNSTKKTFDYVWELLGQARELLTPG